MIGGMIMELKIKDPGSALTHFIAMLAAMAAAAPLLVKAASVPGTMHLKALSVFIVSMILLYAASTVYHTFDISEHVNKILRKIDHMMIFILIAGTYTPVCLIVLGNKSGYRMLSLVWGIAIVGIIINALWINCMGMWLPRKMICNDIIYHIFILRRGVKTAPFLAYQTSPPSSF